MAQGFELIINIENDAFTPDAGPEIARLLREAAQQVEDGGYERVIRLRDVNGDRVGFAAPKEV